MSNISLLMMNEHTDSTPTVSAIRLTDEQLQQVEKLAGLDYRPDEIAMYLDVPSTDFIKAVEDNTTAEYYHFERGKLLAKTEVTMKVQQAARDGNLTAAEMFNAARREKGFEISKLDIFGGFKSKADFQKLYNYIADGSKGTLSDNEARYFDQLQFIFILDGQFGRRKTIAFLTKKPNCYTFETACSMYDEAMELFFSGRRISKETLRQKLADSYDELYSLAVRTARTTKDLEIAGDLLMQKAKILRLDQPDAPKVNPADYTRPVRINTIRPEDVGIIPANRDELARQIDAMVLPERLKRHLRQDAGIEDINFVEILENGKEKSE